MLDQILLHQAAQSVCSAGLVSPVTAFRRSGKPCLLEMCVHCTAADCVPVLVTGDRLLRVRSEHVSHAGGPSIADREKVVNTVAEAMMLAPSWRALNGGAFASSGEIFCLQLSHAGAPLSCQLAGQYGL